ncbi:hypothetical protein E2L07_05690 [Halalkalibacterium halodurans]|uniref:phage minor head protein n=1 Tax=Halalkalibacterium halodurans TaxID=86665 RepID=UPI001067DAD3|nr:phage minor head protein [Halalkalibacterium halodurans]TES56178.1 hypothetical protein E2L07_05690 [Halalkalibacterium halodurans]
MNKVQDLVANLNDLIRKELAFDSKLSEVLADFPGKEKVETFIEEYEAVIAFLLLRMRNHFIDALHSFIAKDDSETLEAILSYFQEHVSYEMFVEELAAESERFLRMSVEEFSKVIMDSLDPEVPFQVLSNRSIKWIEEWSQELAELMNLSTQNSVEKILTTAINEGKGIDYVERELMEHESFSRQRARTTAITEVLTASSVAQQESYSQSPAVIGKRWKHSGTKGIDPRENHMALDGTVVPVDEPFVIPGSEEVAMFPRDPNLSAKERVNCHCALGPAVDESITGLSPEEKQAIRDEALAEMNSKGAWE